MTVPNDHEHAGCGEVLIVRLKRQAESASQVSKMMAEAKSRRQDDGTRSDLYSWSTPEQTLEYQAAEHIAALTAEVERQKAIVSRIQGAARTIMHAEGEELAVLRKKSQGGWVASQTLESEREANALLTAELERVRAETIEAAARVAENMPIQIYRGEGREWSCKPATFDDAATAIRALAGEGV